MTGSASAEEQEVCQQVKVSNSLGLHARPAMLLVDLANRFEARMEITKGSQRVDAKSIMQVMTLAATQGTELTLIAHGEDAAEALEALAKLIADGFNEE